jgi:hypothetical protein
LVRDEQIVRYRILALDANGDYYSVTIDEDQLKQDSSGNFTFVNFDLKKTPDSFNAMYPVSRDAKLKFIPFTFVNVTNNKPGIEVGPLESLGDLDISIYRGDADYRQALYMQAQATPVITGVSGEDKIFFGAGATIELSDDKAKASMLEVSGAGLSSMKSAQDDMINQAVAAGIALIDKGGVEAAKTLEIRSGIKSASMETVVKTGANGVNQSLQHIAMWIGADENSITTTPNTDFTKSTATAREFIDFWTGILQGAPVSTESFHEWARDNDFTKLSFEDEQRKIAGQEDVSVLAPPNVNGAQDEQL